MKNYIVQISSDALMEMSLAALEAYVVPPIYQPKSAKRAGQILTKLETYGLLWGHEIQLPDGDTLYHIQKLTVDAMAERRQDSVLPSEGMKVMKDMITSFWPQYELLGDFHTHPFDHYTEVNKEKGFEFSEQDRLAMLALANDDINFRVGLVMTIASLKRASEMPPEQIDSHIICWTMNNYRFWLTACAIIETEPEADMDHDDEPDDVSDLWDEDEATNEVILLPNSSDWSESYEAEDIHVILHCPYLTHPWPATMFGRIDNSGKHQPGAC